MRRQRQMCIRDSGEDTAQDRVASDGIEGDGRHGVVTGDHLPGVDLRELAAERQEMRAFHNGYVIGDVLYGRIAPLRTGASRDARNVGTAEDRTVAAPGAEHTRPDVGEEQDRSAIEAAPPLIGDVRAE